jgi:hypothetical protein
MTASFHIFYDSCFSSHLIVRRFLVYVIEIAAKRTNTKQGLAGEPVRRCIARMFVGSDLLWPDPPSEEQNKQSH